MSQNLTRRRLMQASAFAAAPLFIPKSVLGDDQNAPVGSRITAGFIGTGSRGMNHVDYFSGNKDVHALAVCDVDQGHRDRAAKSIGERNKKLGRTGEVTGYPHYEDLLARKDIDIVVITTPDHWHTKILIEALKAGKDVYCEKPMTLTIDEGKMICKVVKETKRVVQVGTQQRSGRQFVEAVALARGGYLGKLKKVTAAIGGAPKGGPFNVEQPPAGLDWDRWQGQTPAVPYRAKRCHYEFRWWYEYSGGKMTDWGAHHVDIATWGMGVEETGPQTVGGTATHPVPFKDGYPTADDQYNTATEFAVTCKFANDVELLIRHDTKNGITFEGEKGTIFVDRGRRTGAFEKKEENPLKPEEVTKVYGSDKMDHYGNFLEAVKSRKNPVSDVFSHHRALTTCHLANIAIRLGRVLKWDPVAEQIIGDDQANAFVKREQRKGYEIKA